MFCISRTALPRCLVTASPRARVLPVCLQLPRSPPLGTHGPAVTHTLRAPTSSAVAWLQRRSLAVGTTVGAPLRKKVTVVDVMKKKKQQKKISMCTAYTYPSAVHVDAAGIDVLLVGDSLAMVEMGHDTTLPVTMDQMIYHAQAVSRGASKPLLVGDMPFGSYEGSPTKAYGNAIRYLKEAGMDCVKLEGGQSSKCIDVAEHLVRGGVAVMGHIGLTPQRVSVLGGFRAQGRSVQAAEQLLADALALERAGCFALVIECVPEEVSALVTDAVSIPTIGIGAGPHTDGQVLVYHDLLGMMEHSHFASVSPKFAKQYARLGAAIQDALNSYKEEVDSGAFPGKDFSPYKMLKNERAAFEEWAESWRERHGSTRQTETKENLADQGPNPSGASNDQDDTIKVY